MRLWLPGVLAVALAAAGCGDDGSGTALDGGSVTFDGAAPAPVFEPFALLADPYLPARRLAGRMRLASSREPEPQSGSGNMDHSHYVRVDGDRYVLMEAEGPGLLTRVWFTGREPATQDYSVMDEVVLHLRIDGADVTWPDGSDGVTLGDLTGGELAGFPAPWVAGRPDAANGFLISVPFAYAESMEVWVDPPPGEDTLFYYQIDWRELPAGTELRSFDGSLTADELADLEAATDLWVRGASPAAETTAETATLAPGESVSVTLSEPAVVRAVEASVPAGLRADLRVTLTVDGELLVDTPLERFLYFAEPTMPYESALSEASLTDAAFAYPFPVRDEVVLTIRNDGASAATGTFTLAHDPADPSDLRSIRITCGSTLSGEVGENLALLEVEGSGHYAGQFLVTVAGVDGFWDGFWMLEGDHELFVDDEEILGTGLEDYFGGAFYYLSGDFALPTAGASGMSPGGERPTVSQYRHHLLGTVPFERDFAFTYENTVAGTEFEHCLVHYVD